MTVPVAVVQKALAGDIEPLRALYEERAGKTDKAQIESDITAVLEHHTEVMWSGKGRRPDSTIPGKRRLVRRALTSEKFTVEELKAIIDEYRLSDWHMGDNPQGLLYNGVEDIFRWDGRLGRMLARSRQRAEKSNDPILRENRQRTDLILTELEEKVRSGTATLTEKERYLRMRREGAVGGASR